MVEFLNSAGDPDDTVPMAQIGAMFAPRVGGLLEDLECVTTMSADPAPWSGLATPVQLLLGGKSDRIARESTAQLETLLPQRETVELAGQTHYPDNPELVATTLHTFFSGHVQAG